MMWSHKEVGGLGRMVRGLLGDIVASSMIWVVPVAREGLAQDWIQGFLDASGTRLAE